MKKRILKRRMYVFGPAPEYGRVAVVVARGLVQARFLFRQQSACPDWFIRHARVLSFDVINDNSPVLFLSSCPAEIAPWEMAKHIVGAMP